MVDPSGGTAVLGSAHSIVRGREMTTQTLIDIDCQRAGTRRAADSGPPKATSRREECFGSRFLDVQPSHDDAAASSEDWPFGHGAFSPWHDAVRGRTASSETQNVSIDCSRTGTGRLHLPSSTVEGEALQQGTGLAPFPHPHPTTMHHCGRRRASRGLDRFYMLFMSRVRVQALPCKAGKLPRMDMKLFAIRPLRRRSRHG